MEMARGELVEYGESMAVSSGERKNLCEYITASIDTTQHDKRTLSTIPAQHIYFTSLSPRTISSEESDGEVLSDETVVNTNVSHPECRLGPRHIIFQSSDDDEEVHNIESFSKLGIFP